MAPTRSALQRPLRISLTAGPAAPAEARSYVRAAIDAWNVPVDQFVASLLTSELVTNAVSHEAGESIRLFVTCSYGHFRVYVHDTSRSFPTLVEASADAEAGRGLMLVASMSTDWGHYRTPTGKAVYFTLALPPDQGENGDRRPLGSLDDIR